MATIVRGTKSVGGGTNFTTGTILASEVNTDFNTIVNDYNGNITDANVAAAAAIESTKVDGYSDTAAEMADEVSPGVTGGTSAASTMKEELQRLRYKLKQIGTGTATARLDATAGVDLISWFDLPQIGPNLIRNGNFAIKTTAAGSAPNGWTLVGTPGTCTTTTAGVTEGHSTMRAIRIASLGATLEGIQQTLVGLKASTKYVIGCRAKVNVAADIFRLVTTGAVAATFDDLALDTSSLTYVTKAGVIQTDTTPTDIVVQLLTVADGDSADITHVWVRECAEDRIPTSNSPWAYQEITTNTADFYASNVLTDSGLTVNVVPPGPGYVVEVKCKMTTAASGSQMNGVFVLKENGTEVDSAYIYLNDTGTRERGIVPFDYVKRDPTPGTTYTYTVEGAGVGDSMDLNCIATAVAETPKTWIRCRAVLESGGW